MLQRIDATIGGIGAAIEKGISQRSASEKDVQERTRSLLALKGRYTAIGEKLVAIRNQAKNARA